MRRVRRARRSRALRTVLVTAVTLALTVGTGIAGGTTAAAATVIGPVRSVAGACLDDTDASTTTNNEIKLAACATGASQQWSRYADGTLRVVGRCADLRRGAVTTGTAVVVAPCGTSPSQRWTVRADGRLQNRKAGLCLQPDRGRAAAGAPATIAACSTASAQRWTVPGLSTPTVPPTPAVPPASTSAVPPRPWDSDFTGSGLSRFAATPWNDVGAAAPVLAASPTTPGRRALRFTMPGGGTRSEVEPAITEFHEGDERWFGFSFVLPAGFPTDVVSWQVLTQWKNDGTGSPPLEVTCGKGELWLSGGYGHPDGPKLVATPISPATTGVRIDLAVHVVFSRDPAKGSVDVLRDGVPAIVGHHPPGGTLYPTARGTRPGTGTSASSYWKMGVYRDAAITRPAQYTIESAKVGASAAAVAP